MERLRSANDELEVVNELQRKRLKRQSHLIGVLEERIIDLEAQLKACRRCATEAHGLPEVGETVVEAASGLTYTPVDVASDGSDA